MKEKIEEPYRTCFERIAKGMDCVGCKYEQGCKEKYGEEA